MRLVDESVELLLAFGLKSDLSETEASAGIIKQAQDNPLAP
jgi:hypothetical protein